MVQGVILSSVECVGSPVSFHLLNTWRVCVCVLWCFQDKLRIHHTPQLYKQLWTIKV